MRVLFSVAGGHGHLYPLVPLARALAAAGVEVAVAAQDLLAPVVADVGLPLLAIPATGLELPDAEYKRRQAAEQVSAVRGRAALQRYLRHAAAQAPALAAAAADWDADVLVRETTAYAGWLAGELLDRPVALLDFAPTPPGVLAVIVGDLFAAARAQVGLPPDAALETVNGQLHLLAGPPGWFAEVPGAHLFQPPPEPEGAAAEPVDRTGPPLVYVTLGTVFNDTPGLLGTVLTALAGESVRVLATVGPDQDPDAYGPLPATWAVRRFVPQADALRAAAAVVCHGGYGSLMGALRRGLPVVCLTLAAADHAANADRLAALGAGVVLPAGARSQRQVRSAVRAVLDQPAYRRAAERVAASTAELPPLSDAAPLVAALARD